MRNIVILGAAALLPLALTGCGAPPAQEGSTEAASESSDSSQASQEAPTPHYIEERHGVYYYSEEVSENDKKEGQAAGRVLGFRYRGKNEDGDNVLQSNEFPSLRATCSDPCVVIHGMGTQVQYNEDSVIGAAFSDVMNGYLKEYKVEKKP